jgi:deoxyribodipyrimidine photo-lyase
MEEHREAAGKAGVGYLHYVEREEGEGRGLLEALAGRAAAVVTDEFPAFFLPKMVESAAARLPVRLESVDSNGLLPLAAATQVFPTAYAFRRFLQKNLVPHLLAPPLENPLSNAELPNPRPLPEEVRSRWRLDLPDPRSLPIDHAVAPVDGAGGEKAARRTLERFLDERLARYAEERNEPELTVTSGLSPYLHFGQISVHEVFAALARQEDWSPDRLAAKATGSKAGWWGMGKGAEAFLDELVTWREVGFNFCANRPDYDRYESLPEWARRTLEKHAGDPRKAVYPLERFAAADTHDPLWNAAQRQLVREGTIHNYLRMLWGKKILEWTASPRDALAVLIELNNRYALDGRDPNSYSGIFWCLGRYDRPWGPERPVFGVVRYMSSENTARKMSVKGYLERFAA